MNINNIVVGASLILGIAGTMLGGVALRNSLVEEDWIKMLTAKSQENRTADIILEEEDRITRIQLKQIGDTIKELQYTNSELSRRVEELEKKKSKR